MDDLLGRLIGAPAGSVVLGDTLSITVYQALGSAVGLRPERRLLRSLGKGHKMKRWAMNALLLSKSWKIFTADN